MMASLTTKHVIMIATLVSVLALQFVHGVPMDCEEIDPPVRGSYQPSSIPPNDADLIEVALNLEYLEAELFLHGAYGVGLDAFAPSLVGDGPPPIGAQKANLDPFTRDITKQLALQEVGHIRYDPHTYSL